MRAELFTRSDGSSPLPGSCRRPWTAGSARTTPRGRTSPAAAGRPPGGSGSRTGPSPPMTPPRPRGPCQRPRGRQRAAVRPGSARWVNAHGKISLAGFSSAAGASYAGEPVEVVVAGGLADIVHAGVVVAAHAQRMRQDQAARAPRAPVTRRAREATAGLTVTRLASAAGVVSFAGTDYQAGRSRARQPIDVAIVAGSVQLSRDGTVIRVHPIRHDRAREPGAFANPKGRPRRKNPAAGPVARVPELDSERAADDQLGERVGDLAVGLQVGLDVLLHGERHVRVADAVAQRLPVDLGIASCGGVAVPYVVQVDLGQPGRRGELLEPPGDRVGWGGLPSGQQNSTP
jgi:hypothetical protein